MKAVFFEIRAKKRCVAFGQVAANGGIVDKMANRGQATDIRSGA